LELAFLDASRNDFSSSPTPSNPQTASSRTTNPRPQNLGKVGSQDFSSITDLTLNAIPIDIELDASPGVALDLESGLSFMQIRGRWRDILQAARQFDPRTQALLNSSTPIGVDGDALILGFRSDLLRDKMEKDHNIQKACQAAEKVLGKPIHLRCVLTSTWAPEEESSEQTTPVQDGGMVATAIRDFGAQVVDVEQLPPEPGP